MKNVCELSYTLNLFRILHGIGFDQNEIYLQRLTIYNNIVSAMYAIITAMRQFTISFGDLEREVCTYVVT